MYYEATFIKKRSYKGMEYHLPEFRQGTIPQGTKELFNYYHSSL
jgi:hypothetical protein